jgi:hypothetical protein
MKCGVFNMTPKANGSLQWKQPNKPKTQESSQVKSQMKTMLITLFDIKGIVHFEFIPQGETVNQACYVEILKRLREAVRRNSSEL